MWCAMHDVLYFRLDILLEVDSMSQEEINSNPYKYFEGLLVYFKMEA